MGIMIGLILIISGSAFAWLQDILSPRNPVDSKQMLENLKKYHNRK